MSESLYLKPNSFTYYLAIDFTLNWIILNTPNRILAVSLIGAQTLSH
jgi:hypothetical protein